MTNTQKIALLLGMLLLLAVLYATRPAVAPEPVVPTPIPSQPVSINGLR